MFGLESARLLPSQRKINYVNQYLLRYYYYINGGLTLFNQLFKIILSVAMLHSNYAFGVQKKKSLDLYDKPPVNDLFIKYMTKINCVKELKKKIDPKLIDKSWAPIMIAKPNQRVKPGIVFRNSKTGNTHTIWGNRKTVTYEVADKIKETKSATTFTAGECAAKVIDSKLESAVPVATTKEKLNHYLDADLFSAMKKNSWGVIYVWTPYMPLSVSGLAEIKKALAGTDGELTILLDPRATVGEAEKWIEKGLVQKNELRKAASTEISDRGLGVHFPAVYIYKDGFLANTDYVGFKKSEIYSKWIKYEKDLIDKDLK